MSTVDRFKDAIAAIVESLLPRRDFYAPIEYEITAAEGDGKFSAKPKTSKRYREIKDAPIRGIFAGNAATRLEAGSSVLVGFIEGDDTKPYLIDVLDAPTKHVLECTGELDWTTGSDVHFGVGGMFKVAGAASFVARADYTDARFAQLQAAFDAHLHPTGVGPSGPPATPIVSFTTVASTKTKTD